MARRAARAGLARQSPGRWRLASGAIRRRLDAMNLAVSRLHAYEDHDAASDGAEEAAA
jgi:hypothetical protein